MAPKNGAHIFLRVCRSARSDEDLNDIASHSQRQRRFDIAPFAETSAPVVEYLSNAENDVARLLLTTISIVLGSEAVPYEQVGNEKLIHRVKPRLEVPTMHQFGMRSGDTPHDPSQLPNTAPMPGAGCISTIDYTANENVLSCTRQQCGLVWPEQSRGEADGEACALATIF